MLLTDIGGGGGRWTDEYLHGVAGQTFKSTLTNIKFIQSVEGVHDYVRM